MLYRQKSIRLTSLNWTFWIKYNALRYISHEFYWMVITILLQHILRATKLSTTTWYNLLNKNMVCFVGVLCSNQPKLWSQLSPFIPLLPLYHFYTKTFTTMSVCNTGRTQCCSRPCLYAIRGRSVIVCWNAFTCTQVCSVWLIHSLQITLL